MPLYLNLRVRPRQILSTILHLHLTRTLHSEEEGRMEVARALRITGSRMEITLTNLMIRRRLNEM